MSQENVEIVRSLFEALNRRDWDGVLRRAAANFEYDQTRAIGMDRGTFSAAQWRRLAEEFFAGWDSLIYKPDEFIEAGEHVVTPFTNHLRGRDGIEVKARGVWVWTCSDGFVTRITLYQERQEALEAVGLSE